MSIFRMTSKVNSLAPYCNFSKSTKYQKAIVDTLKFFICACPEFPNHERVSISGSALGSNSNKYGQGAIINIATSNTINNGNAKH